MLWYVGSTVPSLDPASEELCPGLFSHFVEFALPVQVFLHCCSSQPSPVHVPNQKTKAQKTYVITLDNKFLTKEIRKKALKNCPATVSLAVTQIILSGSIKNTCTMPKAVMLV